MNYETFLKLLLTYKKIEQDLRELDRMGFDFFEGKYPISEQVYDIFEASLFSHFSENGVEWINWFIYENEWGTKDWSKYKRLSSDGKLIDSDPIDVYGATDENGNPICHSFESTWEYIKQYLKK